MIGWSGRQQPRRTHVNDQLPIIQDILDHKVLYRLAVGAETAYLAPMDRERVRAALAALGNATRLEMVELIAQAGDGGALPSALADAVGIPRNLLGAHLLVLEKSGIVAAERQGRNRICRIDASTMAAIAKFIEGYAYPPDVSR